MQPAELHELAGKCINTSGDTVKFEISTMPGATPRRYTVKPLEQVEIAPGYCLRFQSEPGRPIRPSVVEQLTRDGAGRACVVPLIYPEGQEALARAEEAKAAKTATEVVAPKPLPKEAPKRV